MVHLRMQKGACLSGARHKLSSLWHVRKVHESVQSHSGTLMGIYISPCMPILAWLGKGMTLS